MRYFPIYLTLVFNSCKSKKPCKTTSKNTPNWCCYIPTKQWLVQWSTYGHLISENIWLSGQSLRKQHEPRQKCFHTLLVSQFFIAVSEHLRSLQQEYSPARTSDRSDFFSPWQEKFQIWLQHFTDKCRAQYIKKALTAWYHNKPNKVHAECMRGILDNNCHFLRGPWPVSSPKFHHQLENEGQPFPIPGCLNKRVKGLALMPSQL